MSIYIHVQAYLLRKNHVSTYMHVDVILPRYHRVRVHIIEQLLSYICRILYETWTVSIIISVFYGCYRIYRVCWPFVNSTYINLLCRLLWRRLILFLFLWVLFIRSYRFSHILSTTIIVFITYVTNEYHANWQIYNSYGFEFSSYHAFWWLIIDLVCLCVFMFTRC